MRKQKYLRPFCIKCPNAGSTVSFSNWHYCNNPKNTREFTIIRHRSDFTGKKQENTPPEWCPFKD